MQLSWPLIGTRLVTEDPCMIMSVNNIVYKYYYNLTLPQLIPLKLLIMICCGREIFKTY